jgi:RNA polymerase sigma factor (sigma-70 family)
MDRSGMGEGSTALAPELDARDARAAMTAVSVRPPLAGTAAAPATSEARQATVPVSFESVFESEYPRLLRALYLVTGSRHEAEELAQDTFVRAYERWHLVARAENRAGYLYRMAVNLYRSKLRRLGRAARHMTKPDPEPDSFAATDDRDEIARALATLPESQREAVVLVSWLGMTDDEAGAILGISPVTVRVRIHRARLVLRPLLRPRAGT